MGDWGIGSCFLFVSRGLQRMQGCRIGHGQPHSSPPTSPWWPALPRTVAGGMEAKQCTLAAQQCKRLFQVTNILENPTSYCKVGSFCIRNVVQKKKSITAFGAAANLIWRINGDFLQPSGGFFAKQWCEILRYVSALTVLFFGPTPYTRDVPQDLHAASRAVCGLWDILYVE